MSWTFYLAVRLSRGFHQAHMDLTTSTQSRSAKQAFANGTCRRVATGERFITVRAPTRCPAWGMGNGLRGGTGAQPSWVTSGRKNGAE